MMTYFPLKGTHFSNGLSFSYHSREEEVIGLEKLTWETITTISLTMHMAIKIPKEGNILAALSEEN